jgi:hypothetical protein
MARRSRRRLNLHRRELNLNRRSLKLTELMSCGNRCIGLASFCPLPPCVSTLLPPRVPLSPSTSRPALLRCRSHRPRGSECVRRRRSRSWTSPPRRLRRHGVLSRPRQRSRLLRVRWARPTAARADPAACSMELGRGPSVPPRTKARRVGRPSCIPRESDRASRVPRFAESSQGPSHRGSQVEQGPLRVRHRPRMHAGRVRTLVGSGSRSASVS